MGLLDRAGPLRHTPRFHGRLPAVPRTLYSTGRIERPPPLRQSCEDKMAKKLLGQIKLQIPAGKANPSPPVGPALGQRGINIMEFCKAFNARTQGMEEGIPTPVVIQYYQDKSFTFVTKTQPASVLLKKAAGLKLGKKPASGAKKPGHESPGKVTMDQVREIAKVKMADLNANDLDAATKIIAGSARAMGLRV